ncbi:hypothetical protein LCGC14_0892840 [marine sediment metagenome]|uniref:Uncharacterized protein n=1 Tax=marine sediment metagenome TaxID=412755 RepID=A0A0F9PJE6_9ZZZZ
MTRTYNDRRNEITAIGGQTDFTYDWRLDNQADVVVTHKVNSTGAVSTLTITTEYTVAGVGVAGGGTITLVTGAAVNDLIILEDNRQPERTQDYSTSGDLLADSLDGDQDRRVDIMMNHERQLDRSLHLAPIELNAVSMEIPVAVAGEAWRWDAAGTAIEHFTPQGDPADDVGMCFGTDEDYCIVYNSVADALEIRNEAGTPLITIADTSNTFAQNSTFSGTLASGAITSTGILTVQVAGGAASTVVNLFENTGSGNSEVDLHLKTNDSEWKLQCISAGIVDVFSIEDQSTGNNILTIEEAASAASIYIRTSGRVGILNAAPAVALDVTGSVTLSGDLAVNGGDITSTSGAIAFGNENLSTTGTLASGALTVTGNATVSGDLQVNGGDITSTSGAIAFGNENLSTTGTLASGALTVTGLMQSTTAGIGIAHTDGTLHVHTASCGAQSAPAAADDLVIENNASGGMAILTPDATSSEIVFGSPSRQTGAFIDWRFGGLAWQIGTATASAKVEIFSGNGVLAMTLNSTQDVDIPSGGLRVAGSLLISGTAGTPDKTLELRSANPIIRLRDTGASASATNAFIEFGGTDAGSFTRSGWVGDGSSGNTDISLRAELRNLNLGDSADGTALVLSGGNAIFSGDVDIAGTIEAGSGNTTLTTAAGLLRHQAINPSIAGSGLSAASGILSVDPHTIASHSDTTATGAQLNTLTNNSMANSLHRHSELVASDGSPDPVISVNADGTQVTVGQAGVLRGHLLLEDGAGGNKAAYITFTSRNGTVRTLWIEDDGTLKIHTKPPVTNADGSVVGAQT